MDKKIVIVGAGAAGVAAASKLLSNGFKNVTILEAENRFGGRVNTIPFGKNVVDMGAQWCHGEKNNVVYEMAKDKELLEHYEERYAKHNFIRSNGELVPSELTESLWTLAFNIYGGDNYDEEKTNYHGSFGNFFAKKYKEALSTDAFKEVSSELAHECFDLFHKCMNSIDGANSWYETSSNYHEYEDCDGDQNMTWKDKGYITVFDLLQNKILGTNSNTPATDVIPLIQFNKTVSKITYNQPDHTIKVECEDGSSYSADHLICTVSLGVLKERHWYLFDPILPLEKINSIDGMMIGIVDKIFLEFDKPFWNENWDGFYALWRFEEIKEVRNDPINGDWLHGVIGFYPAGPHQPNAMHGWVLGDEARIMEQKTDEEVKDGALKCLRMFLKESTIPDAKSIVRSKWGTNPHFRGSYSHYSLKSEALEASPQKLGEPLKDSNGKLVIQFAGEATSSTHFGNVHGAIESGWREADRLIEFYK